MVGGRCSCGKVIQSGYDGSTGPLIKHLASNAHRIGPNGPLPPRQQTVRRAPGQQQLVLPTRIPQTGRQYNRLSNLLAFWLAAGCRPMATVEDPSFRTFCAAMFEGFPVPGRHAMGRRVAKLYASGLEYVKQQLGTEFSLPNLTSDGWTSRS